MTASADQFHGVVGAALDELTRPRIADAHAPLPTLDALFAAVGARATAAVLGERWRWRGQEAARLVASYLHHLQPLSGWRRVETPEMETLLWTDGTWQISDVISSRRRDTALWSPRTSGLPRRLLRDGRDRHGEAFVGVRLLALAAPARSLFVGTPTGAPAPLATTAWWFGPPTCTAVDLVAAAAGEVEP